MNQLLNNNPISCLLQGLKLLSDQRLRSYLLIPLLINTALYTMAFVIGYYTVAGLIHSLIPEWLSWLNWILWPLFFISFSMIGFFSFTLLANLIAAPFYSRLTSKVLQILDINHTPAPQQPWQKVLWAETKRSLYLLLRMAPLLVLFLIPVINLAAPILWTLFAAWGMAMEFMAYPLEEYGLLFDQQKQFMTQNRIQMLIFGAIIALAMTIPVINLLIGQTAIIAACVFVKNHQALNPKS